MSQFWLVAASCFLSLAWILPNHSQPWLSFHGDAWAALMLTIVAVAVFLQNKFAINWHWLTVVVLGVVVIPLVQFGVGMVSFFGVAWINAAYLLGFLLAILVGAAWEQGTTGQCADYLFLATGIASIVSVGLQLHQFFDLEAVGPWILASSGTRHYANMAQPNQLASLLLLGLLGTAWGFYRKQLSSFTAILIASFLLSGIALTESRTGWLNVAFLLIVTVIWRRLVPSKSYVWVVVGLSAFFCTIVLMLPFTSDLLRSSGISIQYRSAVGDPRWTAWGMFLRAAMHQPLFGFGWGQLAHAQFLMLDERIALGGSYLQAHNLVIDLILWNGVPIGLGIAVLLAWWYWSVARCLKNFSQLLLMSFLLVLGIHSMLEYPLQYAYFLFPAGLVMGCLNVSLGLPIAFSSAKWLNGSVLILAVAVLTVTVRDYFRVETSFYGLRFEQKKINVAIPRTPPDVLVLTQWRDYIKFARVEPRDGINSDDIAWMRNLVITVPSAFVMYRFAAVLVFNDQPDEAQLWLKRVCLVSPLEHCEAIKTEWARQSLLNERIAAVPWPENPK